MNKRLRELTIGELTRSLILSALDYWPEEDERHQVAALLAPTHSVLFESIDDPNRCLYLPLSSVISKTYTLQKTITVGNVKYRIPPTMKIKE